MSSMDSEQFFLKWNNFESNLASGFADLLQKEAMVDVTLAAEGKIVQAHKIILSVCSSYFKKMFQVNPCQHPIVVLKDVRYQELTDMLDFMYKGEANVRQEDLPSFLKLAETLRVKGLAGNQGELDENSVNKNSETEISNLTKDSSPFIREEPSSEFLDKVTLARKKAKRCSSPLVYTEAKDLSHAPNIKLEMEECDNNFIRIESNCQNPVLKEERLGDNSTDSYVENHTIHENTGVEKIPGPSTLEENPEAAPQEFIFRFNPKRVPIWDFYIVNRDYDMAVCKVCNKIIKTRRRDGTRNVLSHMRNLHPSQYALALQFKERWKTMKQQECFDFYRKKLETSQNFRNFGFLESRFGGHLLILGGYLYRRKSITSEKSYWFCCSAKCSAKGILLAGGEFQVTHPVHNHEPDFEKIKRKEKLIELKKLALQLNVSGQELLEALDIKDDVKKYLDFIRTCRRRNRKRSKCSVSSQAPIHGGLLNACRRQDSRNPQNEKCKYWRCKVKNCKSRAKTDDFGNLTILQPLHSHSVEESEERLKYFREMTKTDSSTSQLLVGETISESDAKEDNLKMFRCKEREHKGKQKQDKFGPAKELNSVSPVEDTSTVFCPSAAYSETFSFEKLMAETLAENYCVAPEFSASINVMKSSESPR